MERPVPTVSAAEDDGVGPPPRSPLRLACAALLGATLAVFGDVLVAGHGRVLSAEGLDLWSIFFYWDRFAFGELARGNLVLWNPYSFTGAPYLGGFQPALLYPFHWLHLILPTAAAINVVLALHAFLAGLWVYLWTANRGLHPAACVLAGIVFMFCGAHFMQLYSGHVPHVCTLVWAPLIFLAIDRVVTEVSLAWVLVGMGAVAMQLLAGNVQYVHYTAMIAGLYAGLALLRAHNRLRKLGALVALAVGGACLAAIQLFTAVEAVAESLRADIGYGLATSFPFPPENLVTLAFPGFFGDMVTTPYWGRWALHEASLFVGVAPLVAAVYGALQGGRVRGFSVTMIAFALVIAFGDYTPLFRLLYDHVPGFASVRAVARFGFLASLFLAMLVAIGFDRLATVRPAPRWLAASALAVGALAVAAGAGLGADCRASGQRLWAPTLRSVGFLSDAYQYLVVERAPEAALACANLGASLLAGGAVFLLVGGLLLAARRAPSLVWAVGIIGAVELIAYARSARPTFDPAPLLARSAALQQVVTARGEPDTRIVSAVPHFYLGLSASVHDVWGGADLVLGRYARFIAKTQRWTPEAILVSPTLRTIAPPLGMLRLRDVLRVEGARVTLEPTNLRTLPRATLMTRWQVLPSADAVLAAVGEPGFDPERVVLLESDPGLPPGQSGWPGTVAVADVSTDELEIHAEVERPAILLITDNYSTGWKATALPGSSAGSYRVLPADYTLRGIPLSAGTHHLRLEYRPTGFVVGRWVTLASLLAYAATWAWHFRRRRRAAASDRRARRAA